MPIDCFVSSCVSQHRQDAGTTTEPRVKCRVFIFITFSTGGSLNVGRGTQVGTQAPWNSVQENLLLCCLCVLIEDLCSCSLLLCFDLLCIRTGISSVSHRAPLSLSYTCYLCTVVLLVKHKKGKQKKKYDIYIFLHHCFPGSRSPQLQVTCV